MAKPLTQHLAELSVCAKNVEESWAAAQKEAHDKILSRNTEADAAAELVVRRLAQEIKSAHESTARDWKSLKAKIGWNMAALKAMVVEAKHEWDLKRAKQRAELLEWEADFAVDDAIEAIEQVRVAALEAVDARRVAEEARRPRPIRNQFGSAPSELWRLGRPRFRAG